MKRVAGIGLISLFLATFSFIPAQAAAISASGDATGLCTQTIDNSASVTVVRSGTECILTFAPTTTTTYSWTRPSSVTNFRVLIVAGGGGGGANYGAGGGAGGFIDQTTSASTSTISITVGGGGSGGQSNGTTTSSVATNGTDSSFVGSSTLTAVGGGAGGSSDLDGSASGGSGGGGGGTSGSGSSGVSGQGFSGGNTVIYGGQTVNAGGGGGAGGAGVSPTNSSTVNGGNGGIGKLSDISGTNAYYAGGGGGGAHTGTGSCGSTGSGGSGGGGSAGACVPSNSSVGNPGGDGINGLGGGGGGAAVRADRPAAADGGKGGSGVVIVRFTADFAPVITGPGSSTGSTSSISITENSTSVFTFSANEAVTWTLSGTDSATFTINSSGVLVTTAKDFEAPTDANADNVYIVIVRATDSAALVTTQTVSITVTNLNETATISAPTITGSAYKGVQITISVSMNVPGKVRFFTNNKRVANCLAVPTTGAYPSVTATCNWTPTNRGYVTLNASVAPTNGTFSGSTSAANRYFILNKSTTR
jgi:hypothetical protein